jgi:hypothetical protein
MKYDIYFHNDFDGFASASIILNFLRSRGDDIINYYPVEYPVDPKWFRKKFSRPTIVVDFLFHPRAEIWFDHHPTAFFNASWEKNFKSKKLLQWDAGYKSCSHLIFDKLISEFNFNPPKFINDLVYYADKIDGALFASAKEALDLELVINQFELLLDCLHPEIRKTKSVVLTKKLINALSKLPFEKAVSPTLETKMLKLCLKRFYYSMSFYKKNLVKHGNTVFIDTTLDKKIIPLHLAPFYYYKKILFTIRLMKENGGYKLGASSNPWRRPKQPINIGQFLRENFGGGGHPFVGGSNFKTRNAALKALPKILKFLNRHS